jgi:hypothetical protein
MKKRMMIVVGVAVALLTGSTLFAETTSTMKAVVKEWLWSNPHCLLTIDVAGADGQVAQWVIEFQAPNSIYAGGYRRTSFKPGDAVTITVYPVKNGRTYGRVVSSVLADGKELGDGLLRMPGQAAAAP